MVVSCFCQNAVCVLMSSYDNSNPRDEELLAIKAIFDEKIDIDMENATGKMEFPISTDSSFTLVLSPPDSSEVIQSCSVSHLLPVIMTFSLPENYPYESPPHISILGDLIPRQRIADLQSEASSQWSMYKDQVLFTIIDMLQTATQQDLPTTLESRLTISDPLLYERARQNNEQSNLAEFRSSSFTCDICQSFVKGAKCLRFPCAHVFCNQCLQEFFVTLIESGEVEKVHCPDFQCSKTFLEVREKYLRLDTFSSSTFDFNEFKLNLMTPPIDLLLLENILGNSSDGKASFKRYIDLFTDHQHALIAKMFPTRLVSCPRSNCPSMIFREDMMSRLVICRQCLYAFCNTCRKSYHSDAVDCSKKNDLKQYNGVPIEALELWLNSTKGSLERNELRYKYGFDLMTKVADEYMMDKLFNEMLADDANGLRQCPTCDLIIQRSDGCNKMKCSSCHTSFCNVCGTFLDYDHPYDHFKNYDSPCYGKLFHGMPGTENL